ncbi:MAG: hypothetical protein PHT84_05480, partial [Candidatus Pacebacteria bacterium]|nr:hypothetical protein [Candidatus Paceibacterota bacterium]
MINWRKPVFYLLSFLEGSKRMIRYGEILKYEKLSEEEQKFYQQRKLEELLLYSYEHVPYYKEVLKEAGVIDTHRRVNLKNWDKIPILTKDILKNNFKELTSELAEKRKAYTNKSGGSTGEPTAFLQDKHMFDWGMAGRIYFDKIAGHEVGQKVIRLWGSERDLMGEKDPFLRRM